MHKNFFRWIRIKPTEVIFFIRTQIKKMTHFFLDRREKLKVRYISLETPKQRLHSHAVKSFLFILMLLLFYIGFVRAPIHFPVESIFTIEEGATLSLVSQLLEERSVILSPLFFEGLVILSAGEESILSGDYFLHESQNVFEIAQRLTRGQYGLKPVRITIPEGASVFEVGLLFEEKFPEFLHEEFLKFAKKKEGYLFPDTYLFLPNVGARQVFLEMRENFDKKIKDIRNEIRRSDKNLEEIIIMASLLEEEARTTKTRRIISGILWKRIEIGMALQVDAVFLYINGKNTFELTLEDLKIDSPYNTYKYTGLPVGPITNPGMDSILAALRPEESPYLFYLSDNEGNMHYSEDFAGHKINKARYLK